MATKHDLPPYYEYFVPTVEVLKARGGSVTIEEMEEGVAEALKLSEDILAVPHGDGARTQFQYELAWVRTYLKKVGAVENSERGVWRLTPLGAAMSIEELRDVPRRVRSETRRAQRAEETDEEEEPIVGDADDQTEMFWKEKLLNAVMGIAPDAFERLCQRILREFWLYESGGDRKEWRWRDRWNRRSASSTGFVSRSLPEQAVEGLGRSKRRTRLPRGDGWPG